MMKKKLFIAALATTCLFAMSATTFAAESNTQEVTAEQSESNSRQDILYRLPSTEKTNIYITTAGVTVYEAENATAYVNPDGKSGRIKINLDKVNMVRGGYASFDENSYDEKCLSYTLDKVGDVPLEDIISFKSGGNVSSFTNNVGIGGHRVGQHWFRPRPNSGVVTTTGRNREGYVYLIDDLGDRHEIKINNYTGEVYAVDYGEDDKPLGVDEAKYITTIGWNSEN